MNIKQKLRELNLTYSERLSQNFLRSENIAERIVKWAKIEETDVALEIGTGLGILTTELEKKAQKVVTFEADQRLIPHLPFMIQVNTKTEVIARDFLKYDLSLLKERFKKVKVVANLPFHISTEIMFRLFEHRDWIDSMTLMFQKEVAHRIVAPPGGKEYGILSVLSRLYTEPEICFSVAPNCFYPVPKVAAGVVHFKMKKKLIIPRKDEEFFIKVVKKAFGQRRKTLLNSLKPLVNVEKFKNLCEKKELDLKRRPETLSLEEFKDLMDAVLKSRA